MKTAGNSKQPAPKTRSASATKGTERHVAGRIGKILLTLFLLVVITGSIVVGSLSVYILVFVKPENIDLTNAQLKFTSMVYANDSSGNPQVVSQINGGENRIWVSIDQVPDNLKNAFISTEDQRFYEHEGVDWKRTAGALANFFLHFYSTDQGGSTITQQLIKNINGDTYNRRPGVKIAEIVTALDLEKKFSKDQILESYLNTIPLGGSSYGVQAAANSYFGKDVKQLDLAQCAVLAGLTQAPNSYNPLKHPDKAKIRQKYVLKNMLSQKMITQAQYDQAVAEPLTYVGQQPAIRGWFVDQVIEDVIDDLVAQKGYLRSRAQSLVLNGGLKIYSTLNPTVQSAMDNVYQTNAGNSDIWLAGKSGTYQSAMVVMDYSGAVLGVEGGRGAKTANLGFNRANDMLRSPGSSIKPIGVYGPAIEQGLITWSSTFQDAPITVGGSLWPHNDDKWTYQNMTVAEALAQSKNTIAVRIEQLVKPANTVNFLTNKLGITTLVKTPDKKGNSDVGLAVGIGSLTKGVSVEAMAAAYQPFGDGGLYNKPYTYSKVLDSNGNVLLENKASNTRAFSQETSTIVNRLLQNNVINGTGAKAQLSSTTVGGKTGTTDNGWDRWFVGITPDYVGAVWSGYDNNKEMYTTNNPSVYAWHAVMQKIQANIAFKTFPVWGDVTQGTDGGWYKAGTTASQ
ncbi:transglycosylase domain-containing protein [Ethanoligenens sp.]|uniref:transglycosylase domain-containing protein n=1 Tax=Ethanoligenens sp. TaxID=2099655 RepID=UPI0039EB66E8